MPTAVIDIDISNMPLSKESLYQYDRAFVLIRYKGRPIGRVIVPVNKNRIQFAEHLDKIVNATASELHISWLHDMINWNELDLVENTPTKATIAVCTRDRTEDLKKCLDALMRLPDEGQEYLVIDNCPSNNQTKELVESYSCVQYIREDKPGLNNARNRALKEARNEIVAFTDDDAVVDPNWLKILLKNFNSSGVACVTGLTMPLELETEAQEAFEKYCSFSKGFKRKIFSNASGNPLSTGMVGAGANMALRKSVIREIGFFDPALDAGTPTQSGGDHEIFARILLSGYQIIYDPSMLSWHRHRRTWIELRKTLYGYGVGVYALLTRHLIYSFEWGGLKIAFLWFWHNQLPDLIKAIIKRKGSKPLDLVLAELHGCMVGPWAYFSSRRKSIKQHL